MKHTKKIAFASILSALIISGCGSDDNSTPNNISKVPAAGSALPYTVLADIGFEIRNGGYGSDAAAHPSKKNYFYALTDRGPNATYTGADGKGKKFPTPDYTPRIGLFKILSNGSVELEKDILLKRPDGTNITGLPNSSALGGTGETPYDAEGNTIVDENGDIFLDDYGLDGEGLAALKDGTFWVSDEYGPHIVHFDANGKEIERINPFADDTRDLYHLPAEFAYRRANRGMEGLTITPDQKTLVGIMQSTMDLPTKEVRSLTITRIVTVDLASGGIKQYLYKQEKNANSNSGIVALSSDTFLVIERDGNFAQGGGGKAADPTAQKHVYKITLSSGTELESATLSTGMEQDADLGLIIDGNTLEQVVFNGGWEALEAKGITPVTKSLVVDMVAQVNYPHDKMEGMIVFSDATLGILNDDDFATWSTGGELEQKYIIDDTTVDGNTLYIVDGLDLSVN